MALHDEREAARRAPAARFDVHLVKPLAPERLAEVLGGAPSTIRRS